MSLPLPYFFFFFFFGGGGGGGGGQCFSLFLVHNSF